MKSDCLKDGWKNMDLDLDTYIKRDAIKSMEMINAPEVIQNKFLYRNLLQ